MPRGIGARGPLVGPDDTIFSTSARYYAFRRFPDDVEFLPLPIEGMVLRELLIDGNGKDGEWIAVAADGRRLTIPVSGCHWRIAIEGVVLTEVVGPGDLSLCVRYTAPRLVVREARILHTGTPEAALRDIESFRTGKDMGRVIQHGKLTLVGEAAP
jgi:hypothetical protein